MLSNSSKKVLFVTYHFPPSAASGTHRTLGFSQHLPGLGWQVAVVAPPRMPWEPVDDQLLERVPAQTEVQYVDYPTGRASWPLRRMFPYGAWLPGAMYALGKVFLRFRPDVVVTSSPPHCVHMAGLYLKLRYGLPWVADFRDPWIAGSRVSGIAGSFLKTTSFYQSMGRVGESSVLRTADAVVVNAPNAQRVVGAAYPQYAQKTHCVANGYDPALFQGIVRRTSSRFVITHAGELYAGRDPRPFLDALQMIAKESPAAFSRIAVEFLGNVSQHGLELPTEIERRGLSRTVRVVGQVSYRESIERMVNSDLLLLIDSPNRRVGVPAKLYEYIGAGQPVLAMAHSDSDVHWVLQKSGVGFRVTSATDASEIGQALKDFLSGTVGSPALGMASFFTRLGLAERFAEILDSVVSQRARRRLSVDRS